MPKPSSILRTGAGGGAGVGRGVGAGVFSSLTESPHSVASALILPDRHAYGKGWHIGQKSLIGNA
jgi:hypothetical protein